jgi:excisionase family DNA binding protein
MGRAPASDDVDVIRNTKRIQTPAGPICFGMAPADKRWFTQDEAAVYLGMSLRTLKGWRAEGSPGDDIPYSRTGKFVRYLRSDLDDYLGRNRVTRRARRRTPPPSGADPGAP